MGKRIAKFLKYTFLGLFFCFVLYVLSIAAVLNARHFKVVDPRDPNFNPESFRVADYFNNKDVTFSEAQSALFLGKKKEFVEHILVEINNGEIRDRNYIVSQCSSKEAVTRIYYSLTPWWAWGMSVYHLNLTGYSYGITACYDADQIVVSLY